MKRLTVLILTLAAGCLSACVSMIDSMNPPPSGETTSHVGLEITPNLAVSEETAAIAAGMWIFGLPAKLLSVAGIPGEIFAKKHGALLYLIYDPLAPNWTIKEQTFDGETFYLSLRAKNFRVGGDGESMRIVKRRAAQLQREKGYAGYNLIDYSEGIESATPFTYRISEGTIQLVKN
ncbi:hypothetical protein FACS1894158_12560 [Betaproteobacteria bacterium]|nr:hypothetical protein FACS1894158_12560 [Betaproteobacteria bacterium]